MKLLVQWTLAQPAGWVELEVRDTPQLRRVWERLPQRPEPVGSEVLDNSPGWIFDLNCQGIHFGGSDHYAVEPVSGGLRVTTWNDDPEEYPVGSRTATVWTLLDPAPDPAFGGVMNTRQTREFYADDLVRWPTALPYAAFVPPPPVATRHGIWVSDVLRDQHLTVRGPTRGWREWIVP